ncbi:RNA 2',3'-cyclic phosphodiesterase [Fodinisporobacter ferrooxydans]|uniref:RNA 2',3'-cyclic phosphodiesterase n=1 Tax=Fodinisporobacter ferrooxydans TaxID=2901836 RepID=A0ABY4CM22_9BACL|nr:RNA 2',3'-cyclic phosphodiesterase [Alicyclobacillaceae bacterium MYW30-H2]
MTRTFIGVRIAPEPGNALEQWIQHVQPYIDAKRWYNKEHFHITIHFLGNQTDEQLREIDNICAAVVQEFSPFTLSLHSIGMFERAKVVWAGVQGELSVLQHLYQKLWPILKVADCEKGARPRLTPHITLGRLKKVPTKQEFQEISEQIAQLDQRLSPSYRWRVTQIDRFESVSTPNGVQYPIRAAFDLSMA